jgi:hypothetical protein
MTGYVYIKVNLYAKNENKYGIFYKNTDFKKDINVFC